MNLLTLWSTVLLETLIFPQLLKKFPSLRGTQRLISLFTRACQCIFNLSQVNTSYNLSPTHLKSILSSHLCPAYGPPSWWFVVHSNVTLSYAFFSGWFTGVCSLNTNVSEHSYLFHLYRRVGMKYTSYLLTLAFKLQTPVNHPEENNDIQNKAKVWNQE
jgi:hypothetical protein